MKTEFENKHSDRASLMVHWQEEWQCLFAHWKAQIIFIAKMRRCTEWKTLSIARNQSVAYNE